MRTLIKSNGNKTTFPTVPTLFDDLFMRDLFDWPVNKLNQKQSIPAVNIHETDKIFVVDMAVPGMERKDFKVELDNGWLKISADKSINKEEDDKAYSRKEFSYYSFERSFQLPDNMVVQDKISAKYKDGILSIEIPKSEQAILKPIKQIKIS